MSSYLWELPNRGGTLFEQAIFEANQPHWESFQFTAKGVQDFSSIEPNLQNLGQNVQVTAPSANNPGKLIFNTNAPNVQQFVDQLKNNGTIEPIQVNNQQAQQGNITFSLKEDNEQTRNLIKQKLADLGLKENTDFRFQNPQNQGDPATLIVRKPNDASIIEKFKQSCDALVTDTRSQDDQDKEELGQREKFIASLIDQYPPKIKTDVALAVYFLSQGKWFNGQNPADEKQANIVNTFVDAIGKRNADQVKMAIQHIVSLITEGKIKVDPNNIGLYSVPNIEKQVTGNIQMPAIFESEPDDSMWNEIVITEFGIPMINLGHPAVKKVLASENPEEDCPGELKMFKSKVYENPGLQKVFGKGGFNRVIVDKAFNLLTLGVAGATTDAGKRADRIVKELKEKGGMSTHRNLLLVKYDDIVDVDPENADITIKALAYNRANKKFMGELDVPAQTLAQFYSAVDPVKSSKIYIEMYNNEDVGDYGFAGSQNSGSSTYDQKTRNDILSHIGEASSIDKGEPLFEYAGATAQSENKKPLYEYILATALAVGAAAAVPQIRNLVAGVRGGNKNNTVGNAKENNGEQFAQLKKEYVEMLSKEGHPPSYILKPKSANKEVVVISKASTGHLHGGKVLMVSLKIGEHQAACFMGPETVKKYFSV